MDFAEYQTKKGKGDDRTYTAGVRQVQKHRNQVRFGLPCLLDTLLRSESGKKVTFSTKMVEAQTLHCFETKITSDEDETSGSRVIRVVLFNGVTGSS